ncbi:beta-propeller domain-containing protein [Candidatus Woesearchaeota archaeon]|nr:beta-propeller domain-containing protein [Candidatus Woesearchaeota archaeon]
MEEDTLFKIIICSMLLVCIILGCTDTKPSAPGTQPQSGTYAKFSFDPKSAVEDHSFKSVEEYNLFIRTNSWGSDYGYAVNYALEERSVMADSAMEAVAAPTAGGKVAQEYSETNVQVAGVDEGDIIKTDGEYIYTVSDDTLFIVNAYPGEDAEVVYSKEFKGNPTGLFVDGDRLAVFGDFNDLDFYKEIDFRPRYGMTFLDVYDISDRAEPELLESYKFEGSYFNSRMIDDYIYLVVRTTPEYRVDYPTPVVVRGDDVETIAVRDIYYYNIPYDHIQLVSVHALDINELGDVESKAVTVESGQNLYMSESNLYITYTEQISEYELQQEIMQELLEEYLTDADKALIEKIKQTDDDVLSRYEKKNKISMIYSSYLNYMDVDEAEELQDNAEELLLEKLEEYEYFEYTVINKLSVDGLDIEIEESAKVPGHVVNQFSMDEFDGVFRIATTVSQRWSRFEKSSVESTNNIYTLDEDLDMLDRLEGLAAGEQIYSTRFMGERLYMVTFRQVDPFFVIDLSNPKNIKELGKLKIPGFSRYLHPYDENIIIGLGQDATSTGRVRGLKISLFDVSDVENPKEIAKFVTDERWAQTTAMFEHHAFLFSKEKELLVIPAFSYDYSDRSDGYNGAFVFHITEDEIELRGLIDHSMAPGVANRYYYYQPQVERSLWIDELLYTKSPTLLRINEIDDLSSVKNVELKQGASEIKVY